MNAILRQVQNVQSDISNNIYTFRHFVATYLQVQETALTLRQAVDDTSREVDLLRNKVAEAMTGKVTPTLVPPEKLAQVLEEIRDNLPANLVLPFSHQEPIINYYKTLKCAVIPTREGFVFITNVPLRDTVADFKIYSVVNLPIPFSNSDIVLN